MPKKEEIFYFTQKDYDALLKKIEKINKRLLEVGQDMGEWARQSSETWHDNYGFEEGMRQQMMLSKQLSDYKNLQRRAKIIEKNKLATLPIGKVYEVLDIGSTFITKYKIGSYMNFSNDADKDDEADEEAFTISYETPIAKLLMNKKVGDIIAGEIGNRKKKLEIMKIYKEED